MSQWMAQRGRRLGVRVVGRIADGAMYVHKRRGRWKSGGRMKGWLDGWFDGWLAQVKDESLDASGWLE
ncbi:hypothetical protein CBR_g37932 [Chara braunii]|uniref:Uncharacterized protein n=1 Tax=Chara braunii TaxID=69332 RepID=A0A388LP00_CHABU|nr:hypothetical protein CBR_g37932 [Chara braunii]|eukprot:GBG84057.1 hypothetical protein CBR_g37932 [Chara braunii]